MARGSQGVRRSCCEEAREEEFVNLVKQTYRVLLTRGMKGYYVFFEDEDTRDFFLSRIKTAESQAVSGTRNCDSATHHQRIRFHLLAETE